MLLEGEVEVPSRADQVSAYCREVCQKLECCPYLFGPIRVGGECPSACQTRPKHEFLLEPPRTKGRKGRKRSKKAEEGPEAGGLEEGRGEESSSEDTSATPSCATTREPSRETSPDRDGPPPLKRRRLSDSSASLQLKVKPTKKEMEEMEELIEESLRESSPPCLRSRLKLFQFCYW